MKVIVFGASGRTGSLVVARAVAAGHTVTAFVHHREEFRGAGNVRVIEGDVLDPAAVSAALAGQDAVLDCIGGTTPYKQTELERNAAGAILQGMRQHGVRRLIAISMMGVGDSKKQAPFWYEYLMMPTFLRGATPDKEAMEAEVRASGIDFVLVRPPLLTDSPATGDVKVIGGDAVAHKITRADLADFMVKQISSDAYLGQAVTVVNT